MVNIRVNDEPTQLPQALPLSEFLATWQTPETDEGNPAFAIALNGEFVPRASYAEVTLNEGDELDIVSPVGGG